MFELIEPCSGAHIAAQSADDLTIEAAYHLYWRHLRSNYRPSPISVGALWRMIPLGIMLKTLLGAGAHFLYGFRARET